jgi:twitching motility two-component system response regulator PilG
VAYGSFLANVLQRQPFRGRKPGASSKDVLMEEELQGIKVLVVDDSKTIRRSAENLLSKAGCEVVTAIDGFDALAKIADNRPGIIFVDIMMPRLDGYQTCALIKNNKLFKSTPVVMLSSKDGLFDRAKGRIVGSDSYITKPFSKEELLGTIRTLMAQTS